MNNKQILVERLYNQQKKSMLGAYLLGAFLGGLGVQYLYVKRLDLFSVTLGLFFLSFIAPIIVVFFFIWVLVGLVLTYIAVEDYNEKLHSTLEILHGAKDDEWIHL